jgi:hypothetical protein
MLIPHGGLACQNRKLTPIVAAGKTDGRKDLPVSAARHVATVIVERFSTRFSGCD